MEYVSNKKVLVQIVLTPFCFVCLACFASSAVSFFGGNDLKNWFFKTNFIKVPEDYYCEENRLRMGSQRAFIA